MKLRPRRRPPFGSAIASIVVPLMLACGGEPPAAVPGHAELEANFQDFTAFQQARVDLNSPKMNEARRTLQDLLQRYPAADRARRMLHNSYLRQKNWVDAVDLYHDVDPASMTMAERNHIAKLAAQVGQLDFAQSLLGDLGRGDAADLDIVVTQALIEFKRGDADAADRTLSPRWDDVRARRQSDAHWLRGVILLHREAFDEARSVLEETISFAPDFWPAHYALGRALTEMGETEAAAERFAAFEAASAEFHRKNTLQFWLSGRSIEAQDAIQRRAFDEAIPIIESMVERSESDSLRRAFEQTLEHVRAAASRDSEAPR